MSDDYRAKLESLRFSVPGRRPETKATVDVHDSVTVTTTEHRNERVDLNVKVSHLEVEVPR